MNMHLTKLQKWLWTMVAMAIVLSLGYASWIKYWPPGNTFSSQMAGETEVIQPRFQLTSHSGEKVSDATWRGKWQMVFFGFTNCPDVCPTTLAEMAMVTDGLGKDAAKVKPLFISIDPARDRVADMAEYVAAFHPAITGLTGTDTEIATVAKNFRVYYAKGEPMDASDNYNMAHTSVIYLVSPEGRFVRIFSFGTPAQDILKDIQQRL